MAGCKELVAILALCCVLVFVYSQNINVTFRYVTSYSRNGRLITKEDLQKTTINPLKRVIFIVNGISNNSWYDTLTNEYFQKDNYNIFIVEWNLSNDVDSAKTNALVGTEIADFVAALLEKTEEKYLDFHFVGISQGAQVSSVAAKRISKMNGRNVDRITAIEPDYDLITRHVSPLSWNGDANFVDSVHSDVNKFAKESKQNGHVDFYINSPEDCNTSADSCSLVALNYFAQSINTDKYKGVECATLENFKNGKCTDHVEIVFGENVDKNARGIFFLNANDKFQLV